MIKLQQRLAPWIMYMASMALSKSLSCIITEANIPFLMSQRFL